MTHWLFNLCFRSSSTTHVGRWGAKSFQITRAARGPFWEATVRRTDDSTPKACLNLVDLDSAVLWVVDTLDLSPPPEGWDGRVHTTHEPVVFDNVVLGFKTDRYHIDSEGTWSNISTAIQKVECPKCHARKGEPCISTNTGMGYGRLAATHHARVLEAGGAPPLEEGARQVTTTQLVKWFRSAETPELPLPAVEPAPTEGSAKAVEVVEPEQFPRLPTEDELEQASAVLEQLALYWSQNRCGDWFRGPDYARRFRLPPGADAFLEPIPDVEARLRTLVGLEAALHSEAQRGASTVSLAALLHALDHRRAVRLNPDCPLRTFD